MLDAPSRPDWRWRRVAELSQYSDTQAWSRLQQDDETTRALYKFKRMFDKGLVEKSDYFYRAHNFYLNVPMRRTLIEALLLTDATEDDIAEMTGTDAKVIKCYHDAFFCVKPWLDKPMIICEMVFDGMPHWNFSHHDHRGMAHRYAYIAGKDAILALFKSGYVNVQQLMAVKTVLEESATLIAMESMNSMAKGGEGSIEVIKAITVKRDMEGDTGPASGDAATAKAIESFVSGMQLTVADPTQNRNLSLPARELRECEYELVKEASNA